MCLRYMLRAWCQGWLITESWLSGNVRPCPVLFRGAAFTSGDVVFIEKKRETAMRLAGGREKMPGAYMVPAGL